MYGSPGVWARIHTIYYRPVQAGVGTGTSGAGASTAAASNTSSGGHIKQNYYCITSRLSHWKLKKITNIFSFFYPQPNLAQQKQILLELQWERKERARSKVRERQQMNCGTKEILLRGPIRCILSLWKSSLFTSLVPAVQRFNSKLQHQISVVHLSILCNKTLVMIPRWTCCAC